MLLWQVLYPFNLSILVFLVCSTRQLCSCWNGAEGIRVVLYAMLQKLNKDIFCFLECIVYSFHQVVGGKIVCSSQTARSLDIQRLSRGSLRLSQRVPFCDFLSRSKQALYWLQWCSSNKLIKLTCSKCFYCEQWSWSRVLSGRNVAWPNMPSI